ncbi:MAG TPA: ABC transporter permease [Casimicrobiaceae bacterium]|nr:ABC transporter permease [Casimicrobiaceae bacterium]
MLLIEAWQFIVANPGRFFNALWTHIALSGSALAIAIVIAIPMGVKAAHSRHAAVIAVNAANVGRTLPSLAVLALVMPLLGTGFRPSLFALTLLALPPILINTLTAIRQVDFEVIDAARGMGLTRGEIVRKVELPLALPVIFAGIRIAAVQVVSGAVLAAYIGGGGLGEFITTGIAMMAMPQLLVGAIPATLLSIGTDQLFGWLQRAFTPRGLRARRATS